MPPFATEPVRVRVPATSANLGPGFDAFGLALTLYDDIVVEATGRGLRVVVEGEGAADLRRDESHLVVRAMRAAFDHLGRQPPGLALHCVNRIPHGRGLGSSAAAIVGGIVAARELVEGGPRKLDDLTVLALAADLEGHPDNVAACLHGGFTIAWADRAGLRTVRLEPVPAIGVLALVPPDPVATDEARKLLPEHVAHQDAAHNAARAALFVAAITGRPDLLLAATEDRLHQDYRAPMMPRSHALLGRLRAAGIPAMISGAGPTVVAIGRHAAAVRQILTEGGWTGYELGIDSQGVRRVRLDQNVA